jgi:hypothetical protein
MALPPGDQSKDAGAAVNAAPSEAHRRRRRGEKEVDCVGCVL